MTELPEIDVVVIGAGPAGLAAGVCVRELGGTVAVVERGRASAARSHGTPSDLVSGVGGAGLFSDGKFSYAPSATALWELEPHDALREAYEWSTDLLRAHGLQPPGFGNSTASGDESILSLKSYPSEYMSLERRRELIAALEADLDGGLITGADARVRSSTGGVYATGPQVEISAPSAVIASGRFGALELVHLPRCFRRVEVGMRVEQPSDAFVLDRDAAGDLLDPKWIRRSSDGRLEWRTFCCCRRGEVVATTYRGIGSVSGRADVAPTALSNFGLNARFLDPHEAEQALGCALAAAQETPVKCLARELADGRADSVVGQRFGAVLAEALADGLRALEDDFRVDLGASTIHLPAIEGVGYYPAVDQTLEVAPGVWAAGDVAGVFRGLVPALISGRMAARAAFERAHHDD